jgi:glycosyltransferase involved in cell wall biosynthesis
MQFMQNENNWPYSIILPVHNEEKFIENALQSIVQQTYLPKEVIVVNDNSTDSTEEIVRGFLEKYPFIQMIHSESTQTTHEPGSKIVHAFYKGFEKLSSDWDVIVKLDADVILPPNYFQEIIQEFQRNPTIGIAGGLAMIEQKGEWIFEKIGNKKQVRGPFKAYSKACFEKIGGLKRSIGWDTVDELLAKYYGFEVKVRPDLHLKLQKPTGTDYKKIHNLKTGQGFYKMNYGFFISLIAAAKLAWNKKSFLAFCSTMKGYFELAINSSEKLVNKEEGKFIRSYRWSGILKAFVNRN